MAIKKGDTLPDATFLVMGDEGPATVDLAEKLKGRKVVLFGLPGAFTRTCSAAHVPSFIRTKDAFAEKGVDEIICVAVNDPFVMKAWAENTGAEDAGLTMLADGDASFTKAIGMEFTAPPVGFYDRCKRFSMLVEDGVVTILNEEEAAGECSISAGETLLEAM
jgi:peroxiredoxin